MGLLDKIKNLFLEDEVDEEDMELEEEGKNLYQEPKDVLPKVMRDTIKQEEEVLKFEELKPVKEKKGKKEEVKEKKEEEPVAPQKRFSFPIEFEEDMMPSRMSSKNILTIEKEIREVKETPVQKKVSELYTKKEVIVEKPKFKPTPVISPVYGVLDKNYKKDEVREKSEENVEMKRPSKKVDFETVRKKAFGNLTDDIKDNLMCENCELYKEAKRIASISSDDLLYDMMVDEVSPEEVTIEKAYDNYEDFGVAYEPKKEIPKVENNTTIINNNTEVHIAEKIEIEEKHIEDNDVYEMNHNEELENKEEVKIPSREAKKKKDTVDDDFFELIDSMYKERIDG